MTIGLQIVHTLQSQSRKPILKKKNQSQSRSLYIKKKYSNKRSPKQSTPHCQILSVPLQLINIADGTWVTPASISGSRNSSVGTATRYRLDGLGFELRWWRDFPDQSRAAPRSNPAFSTKGTGVSLPGVKRPRRGVDHSLPNQRRG